MKSAILLVWTIIAGPVVMAQELEFFGEDLSFTLQEDQFIVDGLYYFRNNSPEEIRKMLFYPFPDTETYGEISYLSIHVMGDTISKISRVTDHGSLFKLELPPGEEVIYHITYHQQLVSHEARYIITTTKIWDNPLETAHYRLKFGPDIQMGSVSIEPDTILHTRGITEYQWGRVNFMPQMDFIFKFSQN